VRNNYLTWATYDWTGLGTEWVPSAEWKESLLQEVLHPYLPSRGRVLEIGPGAGEYSEVLLQHASQLTLVDIVPRCLKICKVRFGAFDHISYILGNGNDLDFQPSHSVDLVFSMNVFIQNSPETIHRLIGEIARVLATGGIGILHHAKRGRQKLGWRSGMTQTLMAEDCRQHRLKVLRHVAKWGKNGEHTFWQKHDIDVITIFEKA